MWKLVRQAIPACEYPQTESMTHFILKMPWAFAVRIYCLLNRKPAEWSEGSLNLNKWTDSELRTIQAAF